MLKNETGFQLNLQFLSDGICSVLLCEFCIKTNGYVDPDLLLKIAVSGSKKASQWSMASMQKIWDETWFHSVCSILFDLF